MNKDTSIAVEKLEQALAHETAHMTPQEQIETALWLARRCTVFAEEVARDALTEEGDL